VKEGIVRWDWRAQWRSEYMNKNDSIWKMEGKLELAEQNP